MKGVSNRFAFYMLTTLGVGLGVFVSSSLVAQDFKAALLKMKNEYADAPNLHIVMNIQAFEKKSPTTIFYQQKAVVKKVGPNYFYSVDENEMLLNPTFLVLVNHKLKQVNLRKNNLPPDSLMESLPSLNLDSMLSVFGKASYVGHKNGMDQYQIIHQAGGMIKQTEIFFQAPRGLLQQIGYEYKNGQYVSIHFDLFDNSPQFSEDTFSERKYVSTVNGRVSLAPHFRTYRLILDGDSSSNAN